MLSRYLLPHWFIDGYYFKDSTYQCKTVKRYIIVGESPVSWQCYLCTRRRVIRILILSLDVESDWRNNCCWFLHSDVSEVKVLVPGAGLGRLAWEIACLGYSCQGNEWSFFMLFSSNFVLNRYKNVTKHIFFLETWPEISAEMSSSDQERSRHVQKMLWAEFLTLPNCMNVQDVITSIGTCMVSAPFNGLKIQGEAVTLSFPPLKVFSALCFLSSVTSKPAGFIRLQERTSLLFTWPLEIWNQAKMSLLVSFPEENLKWRWPWALPYDQVREAEHSDVVSLGSPVQQ